MRTKAKPPKFNMTCNFANPTNDEQRINILKGIYGIYDEKELLKFIVNKSRKLQGKAPLKFL